MTKLQDFFISLWTKKFFKKFSAYILLIFIFYFFRNFLWIFLLTFIFSYLFYSFWKYLKKRFDELIDKSSFPTKTAKLIKRFVPLNSIIILEYIGFVWLIVFVISSLIPQLLGELYEISKTVPLVTDQVNTIALRLEEVKTLNTEIWLTVNEIMSDSDMNVIKTVFDKLQAFWIVFLQFVLSIILSFVFILDRKTLRKYFYGVKSSNFWFLYKEYAVIFNKIVKSFWLILKAQSMIALINTAITITGFYIIWLLYGGFPYLLTMALIVFFASFIPILWMWLSAIPLTIIAYLNGWFNAMVLVFLMIIFTIAFEAYFLNPKIVSHLFKLPVSLTFVILFVSEQFFGIAGLLIGVSLFYFIVSLFWDFDKLITQGQKKKT